MNSKLLISAANKFGTPLYVYDGDLIIKRYKELYGFIPWKKLKIFYAMKANYNVEILKLLLKNNAFLDCVSPGEVKLALKVGYSPDRILYTANNITDDEMKEVKESGVLMNLGSLSRLEKFGKAFSGSEVCIRFNPDVVAGSHELLQVAGDDSSFGILLKDLDKVLGIVKKYELKVVGLHEHTGSGISDTKKSLKSINNLLAIAKRENFPDLKFMDFGGGFKVPYKPGEKRVDYKDFGKQVVKIFSEHCKVYGGELEMYFEPGKHVVAESGCLIVEVNTVRDNNGKLIAGVNSGMNHLIRPALYKAYHHIVNLTNPRGKLKKYGVDGNICEIDKFAVQREIAEIRENDLLAIENAGAYGYAMGSLYNLRALPAEVLILNGKITLARKRLSNDEVVKGIFGETL